MDFRAIEHFKCLEWGQDLERNFFSNFILFHSRRVFFLTNVNVNKAWFYLLMVSWRVNLGIYL